LLQSGNDETGGPSKLMEVLTFNELPRFKVS